MRVPLAATLLLLNNTTARGCDDARMHPFIPLLTFAAEYTQPILYIYAVSTCMSRTRTRRACSPCCSSGPAPPYHLLLPLQFLPLMLMSSRSSRSNLVVVSFETCTATHTSHGDDAALFCARSCTLVASVDALTRTRARTHKHTQTEFHTGTSTTAQPSSPSS